MSIAVTAQALLAQLILVGFLFLVAHISPYTKPIDNYLQMFSIVGARSHPLPLVQVAWSPCLICHRQAMRQAGQGRQTP